jgi:hypothetical protein
MADEKQHTKNTDTTAPVEKIVSEKVAIKDKDSKPVAHDKKNWRGLIITLAILGVILLFLIGAGAYMLFNNSSDYSDVSNRGFRETRMMQRMAYNSGSDLGYGSYQQTTATNDSVTTTIYNYVRGVVVAVNGDNIVIAGNGKQTTIKTNASTMYTTKPVVNDTVTVVGTTTDSTITATEIGVTNN